MRLLIVSWKTSLDVGLALGGWDGGHGGDVLGRSRVLEVGKAKAVQVSGHGGRHRVLNSLRREKGEISVISKLIDKVMTREAGILSLQSKAVKVPAASAW